MPSDGISNSAPARFTGEQTDFSLQTADTDGIKTSAGFATQTTELVLEGADFNGVLMTNGALNTADARNVTVSLSATVGAFNAGSKVKIEGGHPYHTNPDGSAAPQVEELTITSDDGNEVLTSGKCFKPGVALKVTIDPQQDTDGSMTLGVGVARALVPPMQWVQCNATGVLFCHHSGDKAGVIRKTVVSAAGQQPIAIDALHSGTDITDLWGKAEV